MATIESDLRTFLEADGTLTGILTGGIYDASELDQNLLTPSTPGLYTSATVPKLKPCLLIRWAEKNPSEVVDKSRRQFVNFFVYEHRGYANINAAIGRLFDILNRKKVTVTNGSTRRAHQFHWDGDAGEYVAEELNGAAANRSTYYVDFTRR